MSELGPASPEMRERLRAQSERRLTPEEFDAYVSAPMSEREREEILSMIRWFRRRYPTPADRLAYARRAYRRWVRQSSGSSRSSNSGS